MSSTSPSISSQAARGTRGGRRRPGRGSRRPPRLRRPRRRAAARRVRRAPPSARRAIVQLPPSSAARSRHRVHPTPAPVPAGAPRPLSVTVTSKAPLTATCDDAAASRRSAARRWSSPRRRSGTRRPRPRPAAAAASPVRRRRPARRSARAAPRRAVGSRRAGRPRRSPGDAGRRRARRTSAIAALTSSRDLGEQARCARVARRSGSGGVELEHDRGERRPEAVVQVAAQPAALLLARGHEPRPRALEVGGERAPPDHDGGLTGQVVQQSQVGRGEHAPGRYLDSQVAEPLAAVDERHADDAVVAGRGRVSSRPLHPDPLDLQCLRHRLGHGLHDHAGSDVCSTRSDSRRSAPTGSARSPYTQRSTRRRSKRVCRLHRHRDDADGQQPGHGLVVEEPVGAPEDQRVGADHADGQERRTSGCGSARARCRRAA